MIHCCCGSPGCVGATRTFNVATSGCSPGSNLNGVTIAIPGVGSCTTSSGTCVISIPANGTYTYTATKTGYTTVTGSFTVISCSSGTINITMGPDSAYTCCPACTDYVSPNTLFLTDENGTWTLTKSSIVNTCALYTGTGQVTRILGGCTGINVCVCNGISRNINFLTNAGSGTAFYSLALRWLSGTSWALNTFVCYENGYTACPTVAPSCIDNIDSYHLAGPPTSVGGCGVATGCGNGSAGLANIPMTGTCSSSSVSISGTVPSNPVYGPTPADGPFLHSGTALTVTN